MTSYYEVTFRPRAAQPNEVTLLIPNIFNVGETVPVNVPEQRDLMNIYMTIFRNQITDLAIDEGDEDVAYPEPQLEAWVIPPGWYVSRIENYMFLNEY